MSEESDIPILDDWGEEALVSHLVEGLSSHPDLLVGPGDDCAVVEWNPESSEVALFKTDAVVESIHFESGTDPEQVGRKAVSRTVSDIAAMGGTPRFALVTLAVDGGRPVREVEGWYRGIRSAADEYGCVISGGETTKLPARGAILSIAMLGKVDRKSCILRSGGKVGDILAVTGRLGDSFSSGRHLTFTPRLEEGRWLAESGSVRAMMDLSDGLGSDLPRLAAASGTGYEIESLAIPCHESVSVENAISDGEDYELLVAVVPGEWDALKRQWEAHFPHCELTRIGQLSDETDSKLPSGWEHYRSSS